VAVEGIAYVIWALAVVLVPIVILLGVAPDLEPSLYFTLVVLLLFAAAWVLLELVLADRRPAGA
jgi:glycopeptide antibiotics resistance protein